MPAPPLSREVRPIPSRFRRPPARGLLAHWRPSLDLPWDWVGPVCIVLLGGLGVAFIHSAQVAREGPQWMYQLVWLGAGALAYLFCAVTDYRLWQRWSHWIYLLALGALLLLPVLGALTPGLAPTRFGATRWIDLGPISLQPSELAKLSLLLALAALLARPLAPGLRPALMILAQTALLLAPPILLILWQPDLGSALVILPMALALLFVSRLPSRLFAVAAALGLAALSIVAWDIRGYDRFLRDNELSPTRDRGVYEAVSWVPLRDYQRSRILAFAAPDRVDPLGIGWNQRQSLISVGSGGLTGKGWTEGTQARLGYLPPGVAHNDFVFSVLAEETGFAGSIGVLLLYGILLGNGLRIAALARDRFGLLLAVGATALLAVHVAVNIAMTIGFLPIKGLPLPLLSYGGTFVLGCCILQGIIQSVYRFRRTA